MPSTNTLIRLVVSLPNDDLDLTHCFVNNPLLDTVIVVSKTWMQNSLS